jgi:dihydrolipoamide dehydrogenase
MDSYDAVVIGAGPAGYVAAIRCAQVGLTVACVDDFVGKDGTFSLGGTCLNAGCIPSKSLLESSEIYRSLGKEIAAHGIGVERVHLDLNQMIRRKDDVVRGLTQGIEGLFRKNNIAWLKGHGSLEDGLRVTVTPPAGTGEPYTVHADSIIIATGSVPRSLPGVALDWDCIVDSASALDFEEVPPRLGIIGAGVIGIELGSVWSRLGSEVVLLETVDQFMGALDGDVAAAAYKEFTAQGLDIRLGTRVVSATRGSNHVSVTYQDQHGDHTLEFDKLIVAVGRKPNTERLRAEELQLLIDENGYIHVNQHCRTNIPRIYAVGDVVRGPMLAHKGAEEGIMVAERLVGQQTEVNYETIPWIIYTNPEIAWVGKTEAELKKAGRPVKTGMFPIPANGRARAMNLRSGLVKIVSDAETDRMLGVHLFAENASEMIAEAVVAMEFDASTEDVARIVHAHPTLSEAIREAALAVDRRPLHL